MRELALVGLGRARQWEFARGPAVVSVEVMIQISSERETTAEVRDRRERPRVSGFKSKYYLLLFKLSSSFHYLKPCAWTEAIIANS